MSSLALMRWLEAAPSRYDRGMRIITLGRVDALREAVAAAAVPAPGARILEIGCGTGAVTAQLVERGASVTALDQNPEMLELARQRVGDGVEWLERTASEIDGLGESAFDAVVVSLAFSEMSRAERAFVLGAAAARLSVGGRLVVADEVRPRSGWRRVMLALLRGPQAAVGWLLAGALSRPIRDLSGEIAAAGFSVQSETRWLMESLAVVVAEPGPAFEEAT